MITIYGCSTRRRPLVTSENQARHGVPARVGRPHRWATPRARRAAAVMRPITGQGVLISQ